MIVSDLGVACPDLLCKIGGVIDIQGFHISNKFIPRQLAIISKDTIVDVIDFKTGIDYHELPTHDRQTIRHVQKNVHFLDLEPSKFLKFVPYADDYITVLRLLAIDYNISSENPFAINNPQAELLLTAADVPYINARTLIPRLPNSETIIKHYTKGRGVFSAANKVSALWRLLISKQFEIKNKPEYDHINSGGAQVSELSSLIAESTKSQRDELSKLNSTLNQVLGDLMKIRIDLDQGCSPSSYTEH